jgi:aryl-alcohol dehydrogenase-like predicted oxidoreductase
MITRQLGRSGLEVSAIGHARPGGAGPILAQHPSIVPIPGTTKLHRLQENTAAATVTLPEADLAEITAAADKIDLTGDRYPAAMQQWINR